MASKSYARRNYGFGSVYIRRTKARKARYYADYRDRYGKRIQKLVKNATCLQDAVEWLKNTVLKEHHGECGIKEQKHLVKFKNFTEMFIKNYSKVNKKSWKDDFYRLRKCRSFFRNVYLHEISALDIEKFKSVKVYEVSRTTVNHYLKILKRMFNIAIEWGYAKENPVKGVKFFSEKDSLRERILSTDEEVRLLEAASEQLTPILIIALNTGMRRGEMLNLTWDRIDLQQRIIQVINTKSGRNRAIPINSNLLKLLNELKMNRKNGYLFHNPRTGCPYRTVQRSFKNACRRAKIEGLRFHDLRHTFASRLIELGVDIVRVKELLGHSTVKVTERYTHSSSEERKRAVELLCEGPHKTAKEVEKLLHWCYTKRGENESVFVSSLFSIN